MCYVGLTYVPKVIAYLIERVVLFLYPSSFPIHSIQETSILEEVFIEIFSVLAAIWEIVACSTCPKQSQYFEQRHVGRLLTCYIYNGAFCDNSLHFDPTNIYYRKELHRRLGRVPKLYPFAKNSRTIKRHSYESIAMPAKFLETQLLDSCHP